MIGLLHGARALARRLARRPGFAVAVLLTLTLGIAANTATFELLYGYLLAPLPYPHADRLANLYFTTPTMAGNLEMSYRTYFDLRARTTAMSDAGMYNLQDFNLVAGSQVVHVRGAEISASLLTTLGVPPALGRAFGPDADRQGAAGQVLLSDRLWTRVFDRDPAAAGKTVRLNDAAYVVAGVMPARFQFPDPDTDLWVAKIFGPHEYEADNVTAWSDNMIVRLAPGATLQQLAAQSQAVLEREIAQFPNPSDIALLRKLQMRLVAIPLRSLLLGDLSRRLLLAQFATALLLLLIWVNLANLFIARALRHRGELVLRCVLGGQTHVLFRELLTESLALCLVGGAAGLVLGQGVVHVLLQAGFASAALPPPAQGSLMAGVALLLAVLSALVFSLVGLYFIRRQDLAQVLKESDARSSGGRGERRLRATLVITQLTLACVLTAIGAMLAHSLWKLGQVQLGFAPSNLVTFQVHLPAVSGPPLKRQLDRLRHELAHLPGITSVTLASDLPFDGQLRGNVAFPYPFDGKHTPTVFPVVTDAAYFRTLAVPLRQGHLSGQDGDSGAVIDTRAARDLFGTTDGVGRQLNFDNPNDARPNLRFRIIGVVGVTRRAYAQAGSGMGSVYLNLDQVLQTTGAAWGWGSENWYVAVRTPLETGAILPALTRAVARALPGVPLYNVRTMQQQLSQQLASRRGLTALVLLFAVSALGVAAVGLYAVASYSVGQREPELGIRAALGADPVRLRHLVLREVGQQLMIGAPLGLISAVILGRVFADSLYGVQSADLTSLLLVLVVLTATTLLAGWVPAWRASRVSPVEALRESA